MNEPRKCVPNSMLRINRYCCLGLIYALIFLALTAEAKTLAKPKPKAATVKQQKPSTLKPMSGAQMDVYVPAPVLAPKRPSHSSEFSNSVAPAKPRMLEGSAEHAETLPAEDSRFAAGSVFDASSLPEFKSGNNWFWLPTWFAGNYKTDTLTRVYRYDYRTGKTDVARNTAVFRRTEKWGWQQDRLGGVWQFDNTPYQKEVDRGPSKEIQLCKERVPVRITNDSATLRFRITAIIINRETEKIEWTIQSEFLQTYTLVNPNRIRVDVSAKSFDVNGKPMTLDKSVQYLDRITGFEPENNLDGKDLRVLFREFLLARNRADLIPDNRSGF